MRRDIELMGVPSTRGNPFLSGMFSFRAQKDISERIFKCKEISA